MQKEGNIPRHSVLKKMQILCRQEDADTLFRQVVIQRILWAINHSKFPDKSHSLSQKTCRLRKPQTSRLVCADYRMLSGRPPWQNNDTRSRSRSDLEGTLHFLNHSFGRTPSSVPGLLLGSSFWVDVLHCFGQHGSIDCDSRPVGWNWLQFLWYKSLSVLKQDIVELVKLRFNFAF